MIREELVTKETAWLLKEAGLDLYEIFFSGPRKIDPLHKIVEKPLCYWVQMVTHAQAMQWLREEKGISVEPGVTLDEQWCVTVWDFKTIDVIALNNIARYPSYEAAAEAGIQAACKYLIEEGGDESHD